ncbi:MAG: hypothetical protein U1F25_16785 [Rubrivivax sp.]
MAAAVALGIERQHERRLRIADAVEQQQFHMLGAAPQTPKLTPPCAGEPPSGCTRPARGSAKAGRGRAAFASSPCASVVAAGVHVVPSCATQGVD